LRTVIRILNKVEGGSGAGLRPAPATAPEPCSVQPFSFLDDLELVGARSVQASLHRAGSRCVVGAVEAVSSRPLPSRLIL
jgi:hypothetical protein